MNIKKTSTDRWELKTKKSVVLLGETIGIDSFTIPGPGEYEVAGIEAEVSKGIYCFDVEDMMIVYIAKDKKDFSADELKKLADCDILFIPVAGAETMQIKEALSVISNIEPSVVIPTYYDNLDEFSKSEGTNIEEIAELKINKDDIVADQRKVYILQ